MAQKTGRIPVLKTYKPNYCRASCKDLSDAVRAAGKAQAGCSDSSADLKGQILYRVAEMLEGRSASLFKETAWPPIGI